jgi:hypothetical protein
LYDFIHNSPLRSSEADIVFDFIEKDKQFFEDRDIDL